MKKHLWKLLVLSLCLTGCSLSDVINNKGENKQTDKQEGKEDETPKAHVHTFVDYELKLPTCDEDGHRAYSQCSECGKYFATNHSTELEESSLKIGKLGHSFVDHEAVEPACNHTGNIAYSECIRCNKIFSLDHTQELTNYIIPSSDHQFVDYPALEATCEHDGNIAYSICTSCGGVFDITHEHEITDNSWIISSLPHNFTHYEPVPFDHIEYWECSICNKKYKDPEGKQVVTDVSYYDTHDILNENVKNYLSATTEEAQIETLTHSSPFNNQVRKTITWTKKGEAPYRVEVSTSESFTSFKTYSSSKESLELPGTLIPGMRYYFRVYDKNNTLIFNYGGFEVDGSFCVRTLDVGGVSNVRDAGGWTGKDGNKVLYDKVFRGGRLTSINEEGKSVFFDELGIKTEIDLRAGSGGSQELVDSRLKYKQIGLNQYTMLVPNYLSPEVLGKPAGTRYGFDTTTPAALKNIFETLADANNYPIYYHCNAGADRTGSLTYLINGLLGVSYEDLTRDFELTTFSAQGNRFRSGVEDGHFVTTGEYAGIYECDANNYVAFGKLHELISTNYAQENGQLCSAIEFYLKKVCDISDETIAAVRKNLLGKEVEFDPVVIPVDNSFTMANGNWTLNAQINYEVGEFYGKQAHKFTTYGNQDHYINNNLSMINNANYKNFHFEVYVPSTSAKWNTHQGKDEGDRFMVSKKPNGGSTTYVHFGESYPTVENTSYKLTMDAWNSFDLDISSFTDLIRYAFYLPYGTAETPVVIYLSNVYVS